MFVSVVLFNERRSSLSSINQFVPQNAFIYLISLILFV
jgi:hypothetical protein